MKEIFPPEIIDLTIESHFYRFNKSSRRIYSLTILFILGVFICLFFVKTKISIQSTGIIRSASESIDITSPFVSEVIKTNIVENKFVQKGDTLVWLNSKKLSERIDHLRALISQNEDYQNDIKRMSEFRYTSIKTDLYKSVHAQYRQKLVEYDLKIGLSKKSFGRAQTLFEKKVKKIIGTDINPNHINTVKKKFDGMNLDCRLVKKDDLYIFSEQCDILSPNATGAILNSKTISMLKAKIICGAANNQLEDMERDGKAIHGKGIVYVPDFLTNRMGIVTCANEQYGYINNDPMIENHFSKDWEHSIYKRAVQTLKESKEKNIPTAEIALKLADNLSRENHPIFGNRGKEIIKSLVENKWHLE